LIYFRSLCLLSFKSSDEFVRYWSRVMAFAQHVTISAVTPFSG